MLIRQILHRGGLAKEPNRHRAGGRVITPRGWVVGMLPGNGRRAQVTPAALRMLALADAAEVEVRAAHSGALGG
jgi:hypothetical protein